MCTGCVQTKCVIVPMVQSKRRLKRRLLSTMLHICFPFNKEPEEPLAGMHCEHVHVFMYSLGDSVVIENRQKILDLETKAMLKIVPN